MRAIPERNNLAPKRVAKKDARHLPCGEYGLTGHTSTNRRSRALQPELTHSAATAIATAPPREVPNRSKDESPRFSANLRTRLAVARME